MCGSHSHYTNKVDADVVVYFKTINEARMNPSDFFSFHTISVHGITDAAHRGHVYAISLFHTRSTQFLVRLQAAHRSERDEIKIARKFAVIHIYFIIFAVISIQTYRNACIARRCCDESAGACVL